MSVKQFCCDTLKDAVGTIDQANHQYLGKQFLHPPGRYRTFTWWKIIKIFLVAQLVLTLASCQITIGLGRGFVAVCIATPFIALLLKILYRNESKLQNTPFAVWLIMGGFVCLIAWGVILSWFNFKPSPDVSYKETRSDS